MTGSGLSLAGVEKHFGDASALRGIDLNVREGEFFTLVGPSGCGKTTTLRVIAGFEEPTTGRVRFGGTDVAGVRPEDRGVGIVFQNYALFPTLTVRENVGYGLRFQAPPGDETREERIENLLSLVDMVELRDRMPDNLSGGQQQRVALARALAPGPEILLLDEPMSALDARLREHLRVQIKRIQSELDITTVYVTHDQAEALAVSDRIAIMNDGRVEQVGTPESVYREPETRFVAEFIGDNNVFDGTTVAHDTDKSRVAIEDATFRIPDGADGEVTFCVRPEDIVVGGDENAFQATVESVEFLGDAYRLHCAWNGRNVLVKAPTLPPDEDITLGFDWENATVL